jgi:hypothetical protein
MAYQINTPKCINTSKQFFEVFGVQGARIGLKIHVKKTKLLRLRISKGEEVMMGNEKINQVDSFT